MLQKLDTHDNYLVTHSTNVCYLAMLLGIKLEGYVAEQHAGQSSNDATNLQLLGLGCLLHDVGKTRIPTEVLNKPSRLTAEEMELMKLHPVYGYEMVKGRVPPAVAEVVLNHHQRWDGSGYPERTDPRTGERLASAQREQIPIFSRIATVVDVFDAATSKRCYSGAKLPAQVLHEMRTTCRGFFDPRLQEAFYEIIPPFPIGKMVTLSDGSEAVVVDFNPRWPSRPRVQGLKDPHGVPYADPSRQEIDLALHRELTITFVDNVDVRPFVATQDLALELAC
jgi:HD-GYP domain-containing protein (c-di-GMP phosphodiesterase class II)